MKLPYWVSSSRRPRFPDDLEPDEDGLCALGGELTVDAILEAYPKGIFPWTGRPPIPWYSPDPRLVLFPAKVRVSRSLAKTLRTGRFRVAFDQDFAAVVRGCRRTPRVGQNGTWITSNMVRVLDELFELGHAHCVATYRGTQLVGGLYGLAIGRAFFGESMFAREPDASKVALVTLCRDLERRGYDFIDCQQVTPHLLRMGAFPITRADYLARLSDAVAQEPAAPWPGAAPPPRSPG